MFSRLGDVDQNSALYKTVPFQTNSVEDSKALEFKTPGAGVYSEKNEGGEAVDFFKKEIQNYNCSETDRCSDKKYWTDTRFKPQDSFPPIIQSSAAALNINHDQHQQQVQTHIHHHVVHNPPAHAMNWLKTPNVGLSNSVNTNGASFNSAHSSYEIKNEEFGNQNSSNSPEIMNSQNMNSAQQPVFPQQMHPTSMHFYENYNFHSQKPLNSVTPVNGFPAMQNQNQNMQHLANTINYPYPIYPYAHSLPPNHHASHFNNISQFHQIHTPPHPLPPHPSAPFLKANPSSLNVASTFNVKPNMSTAASASISASVSASRTQPSQTPTGMEEIDTKEVAARITQELKRYSIPQAVFASRVLCRSQGTLSDLLRNPKPWHKLKSGRETFRRMSKWLQEPEFQRMQNLRLAACNKRKEDSGQLNINPAKHHAQFIHSQPQPNAHQYQEGTNFYGQYPMDQQMSLGPPAPPVPSHQPIAPHQPGRQLENIEIGQNLEQQNPEQPTVPILEQTNNSYRQTPRNVGQTLQNSPTTHHQPPLSSLQNSSQLQEQYSPLQNQQEDHKKVRLVFTELQRTELYNAFKRNKRPTKDEHIQMSVDLGLELSTVQNFFMNARRRSLEKWSDMPESHTTGFSPFYSGSW